MNGPTDFISEADALRIALAARIQELGWVVDERDELRNRLAELAARRCDGCAHATPIPMQYATPGPERWYWCGNAAKNGNDWGAFTADGPFVVAASHSCAAWTEKPQMMTGIWPSRAGEGTHDPAAWTEKP